MLTGNHTPLRLTPGRLSWERVPKKSRKTSQSKPCFAVEKDSIRIKTNTFSLWSIFACGGPRRKRATVFANRPNPQSDLIYLRFYVYSDNEDSKRVSDRLNDMNKDTVIKIEYGSA